MDVTFLEYEPFFKPQNTYLQEERTLEDKEEDFFFEKMVLPAHLNSSASVPQSVEEQIVRQRQQSEDKTESTEPVIGAD